MHVYQFLAPQYPAHLKQSIAEAREKVASIKMLDSDEDGEADWYLADWHGDPYVRDRTIIHVHYEGLHAASSVVSYPFFHLLQAYDLCRYVVSR